MQTATHSQNIRSNARLRCQSTTDVPGHQIERNAALRLDWRHKSESQSIRSDSQSFRSSTSGARGEPSSCIGRPGSRHPGGADHGGARDGARCRLAHSCCVLAGRVELALFDVARSGRPPQYDTGAEARVTALACTTPPAGKQRWTLMELERAARQEQGLSNVSRETVRRMLKKTTSSPGAG